MNILYYYVLRIYLPLTRAVVTQPRHSMIHCLDKSICTGTENYILRFGDFNGRIGNAHDMEHNDDTSQNCHPVDAARNKYGHYLIEFLRDSGMCVMNSRVNP